MDIQREMYCGQSGILKHTEVDYYISIADSLLAWIDIRHVLLVIAAKLCRYGRNWRVRGGGIV